MVLTAFFIFQCFNFDAVDMVLRFAFIVKTTFDINCTKGHGE
jgi:hypothetical protein